MRFVSSGTILAMDAIPEAPHVAQGWVPEPTRSSERGLKTVLIADDSASGRELLRIVIEMSGYGVVEAIDGRETISEAKRNRPDLIILELLLPHIDGFAVIRELHDVPRLSFVPVIALTSCAMVGDRERAMNAGFAGYLTKPTGLATLRSEVARHLFVPRAA